MYLLPQLTEHTLSPRFVQTDLFHTRVEVGEPRNSQTEDQQSVNNGLRGQFSYSPRHFLAQLYNKKSETF